MPEFNPPHDALSAVPGDTLEFVSGEDRVISIVSKTLWIPRPKGGKVYGYEMESGETISHEQIIKVTKRPLTFTKEEQEALLNASPDQEYKIVPSPLYQMQTLMTIVESMEMPATFKVAIACMLEGDEKSLRGLQSDGKHSHNFSGCRGRI